MTLSGPARPGSARLGPARPGRRLRERPRPVVLGEFPSDRPTGYEFDSGPNAAERRRAADRRFGTWDLAADYDRDALFLTSKVLPSNLHYEDVLDSLSASLDRLGTDYLDLYLIHWPNPTISLRETFHNVSCHCVPLVPRNGVANQRY
ncbi:MAG: aldo/keto reductase [Haloquadratum sp.]